MSQASAFSFLVADFPRLAQLTTMAEGYAYNDPPACLGKLRVYGEKLVDLLYDFGRDTPPFRSTFHDRLQDLKQKRVLPQAITGQLNSLKRKGNRAVHEDQGNLEDAEVALKAAYRIGLWLVDAYGTTSIEALPAEYKLPAKVDHQAQLEELEREHRELEKRYQQLEKKLVETILQRQQTEQNARLEQANQRAENRELSEAETRKLIDAQLQEAGWEADSIHLTYQAGVRPQPGRNLAIAEWPVTKGRADYALFIGLEFYGVVEAKKRGKDVASDLTQAQRYAEDAYLTDDIRWVAGHPWGKNQVPFLFATNSRAYTPYLPEKSGIWFCDLREPTNQAKPLQGWPSPRDLRTLIEHDVKAAEERLRKERRDFLRDPNGLSLRYYQMQAIEAVETTLLSGQTDRALLAMATGTGKTRTIVGLCYRLLSSQRMNRVLFLVDRTLLGEQAQTDFKEYRVANLRTFADIYNLKELADKFPDEETRIHFSTVQGMYRRIFQPREDEQPPTVGTYDCIIVDEAHRGYNLDQELTEEELNFKNEQDFRSKYSMVLEYFEAFKVGLTATPALHTVEIFGKPVFRYTYRQAVIEGYLIDHEPPINLKTQLNQEGIKWKKGEKPKVYDRRSHSVEELDELEDEMAFEVDAFNRKVLTEPFNRTVIRELVQDLDPEGEEKTLIFAATDDHADLVVRLLHEEFTELGVELHREAIMKITGSIDQPLKWTRAFKHQRYPNIVVTVSLLTTGVDVPKICNLVFLRRVRSRILYEQMLGRATRRADEIGKSVFRIYDAVRLYEALEEVSTMKPVVTKPQETFADLHRQLDAIQNEERLQVQIEQIIAKLQRKKRDITDENAERFTYYSGGREPEAYLQHLLSLDTEAARAEMLQRGTLFRFLDQVKRDPEVQFVSEHADNFLGRERGYGQGEKPQDYLDAFRTFILENQNQIAALNLVCTRPRELTRQALRELKLQLDEAGFTQVGLNTAWQEAKNEAITADLIAFIRTLAMGDPLISQEERVRQAMQRVRAARNWNKIQLRWLEKIELQLIKESIIDREAFDQEPFKSDGGYRRLNKIFGEDLDGVVQMVNGELYRGMG